jgi:hypothetical protein
MFGEQLPQRGRFLFEQPSNVDLRSIESEHAVPLDRYLEMNVARAIA